MDSKAITSEVSDRICRHMNADHIEAVFSYAKHYAGIGHPNKVKMVKITQKAMHLIVDNSPVKISFDHLLKDSVDAHQTLVKMIKDIPKDN